MPTESELRSFLQETGPADARAQHSLDASSILRRSRRRRLPKQLALGGAATLAVAGFSVAGVQGIGLLNPSYSTTSADGSTVTGADPAAPGATDTAGGGMESIKRAPASKLNLCGGTLADVAPSVTGLVLTAEFPVRAATDAMPVTGTVTMTNTGTQRVTGSTGATPAVTLSQNGTVLWHSNGPEIAMAMLVDLAPGESLSYSASFLPVSCSIEDDSAEAFRENLPQVAAGEYQLSAAIDINLDAPVNGAPQLDLVTGPLSTINLD